MGFILDMGQLFIRPESGAVGKILPCVGNASQNHPGWYLWKFHRGGGLKSGIKLQTSSCYSHDCEVA